jgi:hypothetical protein
MGLFGPNKKESEIPNAPVSTSVPVDKVIEMRNRNLTNNQIVETLQRDGHSMTQVFDAMNQADLKTGVNVDVSKPTGAPSNPIPLEKVADTATILPKPVVKPVVVPIKKPIEPQPIPPQSPPQALPSEPQPLTPIQPEIQQPFENIQTMEVQPSGFTDQELTEKIEEVTETIIEEKWHDFADTIERIIDWKNSMKEKFDGVEKDIVFLKQEFDKLHTAILKKVDQYDRSMGNVGAQLKAMEMVFKDVLPKFTENINALNDVTSKVKKK